MIQRPRWTAWMMAVSVMNVGIGAALMGAGQWGGLGLVIGAGMTLGFPLMTALETVARLDQAGRREEMKR